jgi:predicted DNA-binding protein
MVERLYRTQILLEPEQHKALTEIARQQGRSMSDVVREMITRQLQQQEQEIQAERLQALEQIRQRRAQILARRGGRPLEIDVVEMINAAREEQDERNLAGLG